MYRLHWRDSVTHELLRAAAKSNPTVHDEIISAMSEAEAILEREADGAGDLREGGTRLLITTPLSLTYSVNVRLQEVRIIRVTVNGMNN